MRFRLTRTAAKYLARKRRLKAVVRVSARDSRNVAKPASKRVTLKAK